MAETFIFGVDDLVTNLGLGTLLTDASKIEPRQVSISTEQSVASAIGNLGNILLTSSAQVSKGYDKKQTFNVTILANASTPVTAVIPILGSTYAATSTTPAYGGSSYSLAILTGIGLSQPVAGWATITLQITMHLIGSVISTPTFVNQKYTITLPTFGFGLAGLPKCMGSNTNISLADMKSYSFNASGQYSPELDRNGAFMCGALHTCKLTESFSFYDGSGNTPIVIATPVTPKWFTWNITSDSLSETNTDYQSRNVSAETYQNHD